MAALISLIVFRDVPGDMKSHRVRSVLLPLCATLTLMACSALRAELVQARLEGVVTSSSIAALNGQNWTLTIVFDTASSDTAAGPVVGTYLNTGPIKALRALDFFVGDSGAFTIHLVDPVPTVFPPAVRIDIDNFSMDTDSFSLKSFFVHVDDASLLPTWNGLQLDDFNLALGDDVPGGYHDGTDRLPIADPAITIDEFTAFKELRLNIGTGTNNQLIGVPSSFALAAVPEVSPGGLCAAGGMLVHLLQRRRRLDQNAGFQ